MSEAVYLDRLASVSRPYRLSHGGACPVCGSGVAPHCPECGSCDYAWGECRACTYTHPIVIEAMEHLEVTQ
jgi:hypothetical protein